MFNRILDLERLIHSTKTVIACLIGIAISKFFTSPGALWIVITVVVVMTAQIYVGSVVQKSLLRFLGTLLGCLIGTFSILIIGISDTAAYVGISISSFLFSYFAISNENLMYAGTLGAATTAIILLSPEPTVHIAVTRFFEISLGILIATLTSQFIMPIHARTHLRGTQAKTLTQLRDYYKTCMLASDKENKETDYQDFDENIVKLLSKQRQLAKEAKRELFGMAYEPKLFVKSLQCEKEILRAIDFMQHALPHVKTRQTPFTVSEAILDFNAAIIHIFNTLIKAIVDDKLVDTFLPIPEVIGLKKEIQQHLRESGSEDTVNAEGYLFAVEILVRNLRKLSLICHISLLENEQNKSK